MDATIDRLAAIKCRLAAQTGEAFDATSYKRTVATRFHAGSRIRRNSGILFGLIAASCLIAFVTACFTLADAAGFAPQLSGKLSCYAIAIGAGLAIGYEYGAGRARRKAFAELERQWSTYPKTQ